MMKNTAVSYLLGRPTLHRDDTIEMTRGIRSQSNLHDISLNIHKIKRCRCRHDVR